VAARAGQAKDEASDFLRELLASGALPVLEIEQEARDAGLLGPDGPISQNKSLRSARDILGITPQRKGGTGAKGQWVWELPATPKMPSKPYDALVLKEGTFGDLIMSAPDSRQRLRDRRPHWLFRFESGGQTYTVSVGWMLAA
jgi:hypothetical protein